MSGTFLEPFLESIQTLPCNLKRNLTLLGDLDSKVFALVNSAEQQSEEYINQIEHLSPDEKTSRYNKVISLFDKATNFTEEKKQLAQQIYNMVDKQIQQLDTELAKFDQPELTEIKDEDTNDVNVNKKKSIKLNKMEKLPTKTPVKIEVAEKGARKKTQEIENSLDTKKKSISASRPELCLNMEVDPNEPLYCICHQVSYGEMIGCDEADCPYEWFHFPCVGLKAKPKGKWYCPDCAKKKKNKQLQSA